MLSMLRSDWLPSMLAGFVIGGLFVMAQQPALASVL